MRGGASQAGSSVDPSCTCSAAKPIPVSAVTAPLVARRNELNKAPPARRHCIVCGQMLYRCASDAGGEAVALRDHHDAALGHREALGIRHPIETNPLAGRYRDVLVDDATV